MSLWTCYGALKSPKCSGAAGPMQWRYHATYMEHATAALALRTLPTLKLISSEVSVDMSTLAAFPQLRDVYFGYEREAAGIF